MKIYCCNCEKEVECILVDGKVVYPHRQDLYSKNFYKCLKNLQEFYKERKYVKD